MNVYVFIYIYVYIYICICIYIYICICIHVIYLMDTAFLVVCELSHYPRVCVCKFISSCVCKNDLKTCIRDLTTCNRKAQACKRNLITQDSDDASVITRILFCDLDGADRGQTSPPPPSQKNGTGRPGFAIRVQVREIMTQET